MPPLFTLREPGTVGGGFELSRVALHDDLRP
jgi:hypothetical protein